MDRKSNFALFLFCLIFLACFLSPLFPSLCLGKNVTMGWDPNPEPDLEGYVIYRNTGSPGPPYKYAATLSEDDLTNPLSPMVTLTGIKENTAYFIAVTAYDAEGNESYFSDEVCVEIVDTIIENCSAHLSSSGISNSSTGSNGGGWNSGVCFINSATGDSNYFTVTLGAFSIMGLVLGIKRLFQIRQH
jgi:hypothetical protein